LAHRDIKPSNLLVIDDPAGGLPQVKILDMGLARFTSEAQCTVLTQTGQVLGTIDYIAPEQAKDTKGAGIVADIFSLGASLFHMLTGQVPFTGKNPMEKLMARAMRDAPRASTLRAEIPAGLDAILARMLERDVARRYQTPAEVARALTPFCAGATDQERSSSLALPASTAPAGSLEGGPTPRWPASWRSSRPKRKPVLRTHRGGKRPKKPKKPKKPSRTRRTSDAAPRALPALRKVRRARGAARGCCWPLAAAA
jgi:serine/threonine protein kinase